LFTAAPTTSLGLLRYSEDVVRELAWKRGLIETEDVRCGVETIESSEGTEPELAAKVFRLLSEVDEETA